jgi:hypothetical protein
MADALDARRKYVEVTVAGHGWTGPEALALIEEWLADFDGFDQGKLCMVRPLETTDELTAEANEKFPWRGGTIRFENYSSSWDPEYLQAQANFTWQVVCAPLPRPRSQSAPRAHRPRPVRRTAAASAHGPPDDRPRSPEDDEPPSALAELLHELLRLDVTASKANAAMAECLAAYIRYTATRGIA